MRPGEPGGNLTEDGTMEQIKVTLEDCHGETIIADVVRRLAGDEMMIADASAMGGQTFQTSGPGAGWTKALDANDYAREALRSDLRESGELGSAIDPADGRVATWDFDGDPEDLPDDAGIVWSDSVVDLVAPTPAEVADDPAAALLMAQSLTNYGHDADSWRKLAKTLQSLSQVADAIDAAL